MSYMSTHPHTPSPATPTLVNGRTAEGWFLEAHDLACRAGTAEMMGAPGESDTLLADSETCYRYGLVAEREDLRHGSLVERVERRVKSRLAWEYPALDSLSPTAARNYRAQLDRERARQARNAEAAA